MCSGPRGTHMMLFRNAGLLGTMASLIASARAVATAMIGLQWAGTSWVSAEGADAGSDVFLPVTWGAAITAGGAAIPTNFDAYGFYVQIVARSTGGSRVGWYIYNCNTTLSSANNRLIPIEAPQLTTILAAMIAGDLTAIDGNSFVCKPYANTGFNDHLVRVSRRAA
jgi:hypothetical protein